MIANRENEDKKRLCERSRVLLISDMTDDYEALKKYGFKTIDWWRSKKNAEHFFSANPSELEKFDIYLWKTNIRF